LGFLSFIKKPTRSPKKLSESSKEAKYKNFQGRNPYTTFVGFLVEMMPLKRHFEIN